MKNNPKTKYLLIGLVVIIWGMVIYRIIVGLSANDPIGNIEPVNFIDKSGDTLVNNSIVSTSYPDPFLSDIDSGFIDEEPAATTSQSDKIQESNAQLPPTPTIPQEPVPVIKYVGNILNPVTHNSTAIILVNDQSRVVSAHDIIAPNTKVIEIQETKIIIRQKGKELILPLNN